MKVIGINGSPRKGWNTHILVDEALKGAASKGAETELVHLYDLNFKGCISCFECKRKDGPSLGRCALRDELRPVLEGIASCGALVLGSPIYIGEMSSSARALIERLTFQYITYNRERRTFFEGRVPTALIYTMNVGEAQLERAGYTAKFKAYESLFERILGPAQTLLCTETWQTGDYGKYEMTMFNGAERKKRREEFFPGDRQRAFLMGAALVEK
jgi:multimeric flavodoxin WrbA